MAKIATFYDHIRDISRQEQISFMEALQLAKDKGVEALEVCEEYDQLAQKLERNLERCWGVSFGSRTSRQEELCLKLRIDEEREPYVLSRLYREGRSGQVIRIRPNEFLYTGVFFDTNEMLAWVKSFTGRILDIQGSNQVAVSKVVRDWETMYAMYCSGKDAHEEGK